ncbi:MAG: hypothetical protein KAJ19_00505 [Gammaproteobacteria bacterium]|nr:hypothetical protein [Gammaproteobacteria bacterium]
MTEKKSTPKPGGTPAKNKGGKPTPQQTTDKRLKDERKSGLREELEGALRHLFDVKDEKAEYVKIKNEEITAIEKRVEGTLRDLENIDRPLPLIDGMTCAWAGCKEPAIKGEDYCSKHKAEHEKSKKAAAKKSSPKKPEPKKAAAPKKK